MRKQINPFYYRGFIFILPNGTVYRQVSREDLVNGEPVYSLAVNGLQYTAIENLLKPISIDDQTFEVRDGVEYVRHGREDGIEVLCLTPTSTFTGQNWKEEDILEKVYIVPVTQGVFFKNVSRGHINVRVARD